MAELTPSRYWRIAATSELWQAPAAVAIPDNLLEQTAPPRIGDGFVLAGYDAATTTGLVCQLGIMRGPGGAGTIEWRPINAEIWVDTPSGRGFWKNKAGFCFAPAKVTGYGLHDLFARCFDLEARSTGTHTRPSRGPSEPRVPRTGRLGEIAPERLIPVEVIGEPTSAPRGGFVYVLKSAYGYKIGRTRSMPNRMRTFGVQLPFLYTIEMCAWFDDHYEAESSFHRMFADKRINGEWFDVSEDDLAAIRARAQA